MYRHHVPLTSYNDIRAKAILKSFYFWLDDMSRSDRRSWNARGAQIIGKIENSTMLSSKDKSALNFQINYAIDKEEAVYLMGHKSTDDDDYSS